MAHSDRLTARALEVLKREGLPGVLARTVAKVAEVRTQVLLECDVMSLPVPAAASGVQFICASLEDLDRWPSLELADASTRAKSQQRLRGGDLCVVGLVQGLPATYLWLTTSRRELPRLSWPVRSNAVFVYKTFTRPEWRGRGLNRAAVSWALAQQRATGVRVAFVDVDAGNHASLQALRSAGFVDVARFKTIKVGPVTFTRMSDAVYARVSGTPEQEHA